MFVFDLYSLYFYVFFCVWFPVVISPENELLLVESFVCKTAGAVQVQLQHVCISSDVTGLTWSTSCIASHFKYVLFSSAETRRGDLRHG